MTLWLVVCTIPNLDRLPCRWLSAISKNIRWAAGDMPIPAARAARVDLVVFVFCAVFLAAHALVSFQVWDRYLLGLVPWLAFILARVLRIAWRLLLSVISPQTTRFKLARTMAGVIATALLLTLLAGPVQDAASSRLPVGGDHGAYEGIDQVVAFLRTVPADTTFVSSLAGGPLALLLMEQSL